MTILLYQWLLCEVKWLQDLIFVIFICNYFCIILIHENKDPTEQTSHELSKYSQKLAPLYWENIGCL